MIGAGEWDAVTEILRGCAAGADRFVVVDTETTGLYNSDRVVEIAIYTLSLDGDLLEIFDTLVNPRRDVSASPIHGITATMVKDAPTFEEIAGDVAVRLHGACLVAHNVPFDKRMLRNEYQRIDTDLDVLASVDTYVASGCRRSMRAACTGLTSAAAIVRARTRVRPHSSSSGSQTSANEEGHSRPRWSSVAAAEFGGETTLQRSRPPSLR